MALEKLHEEAMPMGLKSIGLKPRCRCLEACKMNSMSFHVCGRETDIFRQNTEQQQILSINLAANRLDL